MGKSNAKRVAQCETTTPHQQHVWIQDYQDGGRINKFFCRGVEAPEHVHVWDAIPDGQVIATKGGFGGEGAAPWNGAFECPCGKTAWLKDGVHKRDVKSGDPVLRFPQAEHMTRLRELKEKLDAGGEEALTEEDKAELQALATALIEALQPLAAAFQAMAESAVAVMADFMDSIDKDTLETLARVAKAYGEKVDAAPVDIEVMGYEPVTAASLSYSSTALVEDSIQPLLAPDHNDPVEVARRAVREPFLEPFSITVNDLNMGPAIPADDLGGITINNIDPSLAHRLPRAQRFGRASEM